MRANRNLFVFIISVVMIAMSMILTPIASANEPATRWERDWERPYEFWYQVDTRCDLSGRPFRVRLYEDVNYGGALFIVCGYLTNLGKYQRYISNSFLDWNDTVSSFKLYYLSPGECLSLYEHSQMDGISYTLFNTSNVASMPSGWNDRVSSMSAPC